MRGYLAQGEPNVHAWVQRAMHADRYDLFVVERHRGTRWLGSDGVFGDEMDPMLEGPSALVMPRRVVANVAMAFDEFARELRPDPGTEAKVLREALDVERARVDDVLRRLGGS